MHGESHYVVKPIDRHLRLRLEENLDKRVSYRVTQQFKPKHAAERRLVWIVPVVMAVVKHQYFRRHTYAELSRTPTPVVDESYCTAWIPNPNDGRDSTPPPPQPPCSM